MLFCHAKRKGFGIYVSKPLEYICYDFSNIYFDDIIILYDDAADGIVGIISVG